MPVHLPSDDLLADYACGVASPGVSLLMAAHLTQVPESRARLADFERVGGILLDADEGTAVGDDVLDALMARLDDDPSDAAAERERQDVTASWSAGACPLPRPVLEHIGMGFEEIPWKFLLPGVSGHDIAAEKDEKISLLRARPGARVPKHTHQGVELTLVMHGALMDDGVVYRAGDIAINDEDDDHCPSAVGDEICYCLIVQQGDLRFTGTFSRILNYLGE